MIIIVMTVCYYLLKKKKKKLGLCTFCSNAHASRDYRKAFVGVAMHSLRHLKCSFLPFTHMANEAQHPVPSLLIGSSVINTVGRFFKKL